MKEYISKDYLDDILKHYLDNWWGPEYYACSVIQNEIDCTPTAERLCQNEGVWEYWAGRLARCPICGYEYTDLLECNNYCGNCGSRLSEE